MALPPPLPWQVRTQLERLILVVGASAALVVSLLLLAQAADVSVTACLWKCATGVPCAGCGGTRALAALLSGSWREALAWNPVAVIASIIALIAGLYASCVLMFRLEPWRPRLFGAAWLRCAVAVLVALNWVYLLWTNRS